MCVFICLPREFNFVTFCARMASCTFSKRQFIQTGINLERFRLIKTSRVRMLQRQAQTNTHASKCNRANQLDENLSLSSLVTRKLTRELIREHGLVSSHSTRSVHPSGQKSLLFTCLYLILSSTVHNKRRCNSLTPYYDSPVNSYCLSSSFVFT